VQQAYLEAISLIERLHRRFLDVVKSELDRLGVVDVNNVQSLILFNIGNEDLTVGELTHRGYYLGTNVTYNLKKLVENGYVVQERSARDRRSVRIHLSDKGKELCQQLDTIYSHQAEALGANALNAEDLARTNASLRALEQFWSGALAYGASPGGTIRAA